MGRTVEIHIFEYDLLYDSLITEMDISDNKALERILLFFGDKIGNIYIIINNELGFGKSSFYNAAIFIDRYFNVKNSFSVFLELTQCKPASRTLEQAENAIGVELPELETVKAKQ